MNEDDPTISVESLRLSNTGDLTRTISFSGEIVEGGCHELTNFYTGIIEGDKLSWTTYLRLKRILGTGGQGVVFLTERRGADDFTLPVALKVFSPERYATPGMYHEDMKRIGKVATKVARIQHDNLVLVQNFVEQDRIRMMVMEWVEGYDLRQLMTPTMLIRLHDRVSQKRWREINEILVTQGPVQPRFKAGVAVNIVRDCLEALAALHREKIVHGDVKLANIMLKRSGHAKLIDIGSAFDLTDPPPKRACTPAYAALEVLEGEQPSARSDLASLGYVLLELLSGRPLFSGAQKLEDLVLAKRTICDRLEEVLPEEVYRNRLLMSFCQGLIAPNPADRFPTAEEAELQEEGAAAFHRQLIKGDMASEYENDLRIWIEELLEYDESIFGDE